MPSRQLDVFGSAAAVGTVLNPASVAVIGATDKAAIFSGGSIANLLRHGYDGAIYPVNPRREVVQGLRAYPTVLDLPETPDTAVIVVPADAVVPVLYECAQKGISSATVITSGFGEGAAGASGPQRVEQLGRCLEETGIRIVGPNTAGLINVADNYVPRSVMNHPLELLGGDSAVISQSGGLCNTLAARSWLHGVGLSYAIGTGEQLDLDMWDFTAYVLADERVRSVMALVEGFKRPEKFVRVAEMARELGKPIILLKVGKSEAGGRMVQTHSGALAGSARVQAAAMDDLGIVEVEGQDDLWEVAQLFQRWGTDRGPLRKLMVFAFSGGEAGIAADEASRLGFDLPPLSPTTDEALRSKFTMARPNNPFDPAGDAMGNADLVAESFGALVADPGYDAVLMASIALQPVIADWAFEGIARAAAANPDQRVALSMWTAGEPTRSSLEQLVKTGLPVFKGSQRALRAMRFYATYFDQTPDEQPPSTRSTAVSGSAVLTYAASRKQLEAVGVPFNRSVEVTTAEAAGDAAVAMGFPVALKLSSPSVVHKVSANAVELLVPDRERVERGAARLLAMGGTVLVDEWVAVSAELLVGGIDDPEFGKAIVFGLGGSFAEAIDDVALAVCPLDVKKAQRLLRRTRVGRALTRSGRDLGSIVDLLVTVAAWFDADTDVASFDINPLVITPGGKLLAVDARVACATRPM